MPKNAAITTPIVNLPRLATGPCHTYFVEYHRNLDYIFFVTGLATRADRAAMVARRALDGEEPLAEEKLMEHVFVCGATIQTLRNRFARILLETIACRSVDNFLVYISELTRLIFLERPEILKSNEKITLEEALSQDRMRDLIAYITDKKVNELSYLGLNALSDYFQSRLGMEIFYNINQKNKAIYAVELRNIIVHNRGKINDLYKKRTKLVDLEVGSYAKLNFDIVVDTMNDISVAVANIDQISAKKFRIRRSKSTVPLGEKLVTALDQAAPARTA